MIKKYAILALILSLITTQGYGMINFLRTVVENKVSVMEKFFGNFSFVAKFFITSNKSEEKEQVSTRALGSIR